METEELKEEVVKQTAMKIFVAVPCHDHKVFTLCVQGLMNAVQVFLTNNIPFQVVFEAGNPYVSMARNNLARKFMESDCTDMVFIDSDLGFTPQGFRDLLCSNEALIAGAYPKKQETEIYSVWINTDENKHPINKNGVLEADGLGTGFMKIKRVVFEKLQAAHPELAYIDIISNKTTYNLFGTFVENGRWYGDDFGFCHLWNQLGEKCWVLPNITFIHTGIKNYEGNFNEFLLKLGKEQAEQAETA